MVNGGNTYFGSDPKEEHRSDLNLPFEIQNEAKHKPPPLECVPEGLMEENTTISIPHEEEYRMQRHE